MQSSAARRTKKKRLRPQVTIQIPMQSVLPSKVSCSLVQASPHTDNSTARPFKRVKIPTGPAPYQNANVDGASELVDFIRRDGIMPPAHHCSACQERHPMGWCRIKIAGVEHCGLCGLAHLGYSRTCPHLNNEHQVARLLETLKESPEPREQVELATKYLRQIRGDLVSRRRKREEQERARLQRDTMQSDLDRPYLHQPMSNGTFNGYAEIPAGRQSARF